MGINSFGFPGFMFNPKRGYSSGSICKMLKDAGAVMALLANKADGVSALEGNESPWIGLINDNDGTLNNFAGNEDSGWNTIDNATGKNILNESGNIIGVTVGSGKNYYNTSVDPTRIVSSLFLVEVGENYTRNTINNAKTIYFDEEFNQTYYSGRTSSKTHLVPSGSVYGCIEFDTSEPNVGVLQVEKGLVETDYVPWVGSTESYLRLDGVDDYLNILLQSVGDILDITTPPLAIACTVKVADDSLNCYPLSRNLSDAATIQYGIILRPSIDSLNYGIYIEGGARVEHSLATDEWLNIIAFWDGLNLELYENGNLIKSTSLAIDNLTSRPNLQLGSRSANADGSVKSFFLEGGLATTTIYTGSDIDKILKAEAKISKPYLALNT